MVLAANSQYPILDVFWTMLLAFGLGLLLYTLVVVFRHLFGRTDIGPWAKALWVVVVLALPLAGSLGYLISQSEAMGQRRLARRGATDLRMDAYLQDVSGNGGYRGVRDVTRTSQAWAGPIHTV